MQARKHTLGRRHRETLTALLSTAHYHARNEDGAGMGVALEGFWSCLKAGDRISNLERNDCDGNEK
jgi:hypothetical protein